jgi:NAD-dependent SIR2 family protein deacetylase
LEKKFKVVVNKMDITDINQIEDIRHLQLIRDKIWKNQASIMVGAGFSRNADKIRPDVENFPLFNDLAQKMYKQIYPNENLKNNIKLDPLKVATQFEVAFSKVALFEFLEKSIPDMDYKPNEIYELLLSLPWNDIFTTNYDTLLERAASSIYQRKYNFVYSMADLPSAYPAKNYKIAWKFSK